jgi:microcystin-dependent protein
MAYELKFTDFANKGSIIVEDRMLEVSNTTLKFPGRGNTGFGQAVNENFLHLLENFSNTSAPSRPVEGQLWYDTTPGVNQLKLYDGTTWTSASGLKKSDFEPGVANSLPGDLWVNTDRQQLFLYTGSAWILVGPNFSDGLLTGAESETLIGTDDEEYTVLTVKIQNKPAFIFSDRAFVPKTVINGFRQGVKAGINISDRPLFNSEQLKYFGTSEKAESLIVDGTAIPASNFLRSNAVSTTDFQLRVRSNQGLEVGTGGQLRINIDRQSAVFQHNTSGSNINFRLREGNTTQTVLTIDSSSKVGINNPAPDDELDVVGNIQVTPKNDDSTTGRIIVNNTENDSIETLGGISVSRDLNVEGSAVLRNLLTSSNIEPDINVARNIGSASKRYNEIFSDRFIGSLTGNVQGNVSGRSGSTNRLTSATTFSVEGDVLPNSFVFDGQVGGSTKTFDIRISNSFISNKPDTRDAGAADEILVNRLSGEPGIYKISKQNFLKTIPLIPIGSIMPYGGIEAPRGWLLCDGSLVQKSDYGELWTTIGHNFGDQVSIESEFGTGFFALPDLRGRFALGADNMGGSSANRVTSNAARSIGGNLGSESAELGINNIPQHDHTLRASSGTQYYGIRVGAGEPADSEAITLPIEPGLGGTQGIASSGGVSTSTDLGRPFNIMNPFLTINYIIYTGTLR